MPYKQEEVPAEMLMRHNGVGIYYTYKNDYVEDVTRTYWFVTDPYQGEEDSFDVRELPGWVDAPYGELYEAVTKTIVAAIDAGVLTADGVEKSPLPYYPDDLIAIPKESKV
jgi:hypothetical protein